MVKTPMQGVQVRSLVGELRSCIPLSVARKKKKNEEARVGEQYTRVTMSKACRERN